MPIPEYIHPQSEVYQQLDATVAATGDHLAACIVGANYDLYRYGYEDLTPNKFKAAGETIAFDYEKHPALDYKVDTNSVAVFAEDLQATVQSNVAATYDKTEPFTLRFANSLTSAFTNGYTPKVGDLLNVTYDTDEVTEGLVVTGVVGKKIAATATATNAANLTIEVAGTFAGKKNTTILITCNAFANSKATLTVIDSANLSVARTVSVAVNDTFTILGLTVTVTAASASSVGQSATVACAAATESTSTFDGITLNNLPIPMNSEATAGTVTLIKAYTGAIESSAQVGDAAGETPWSADADGVTIADGLGMLVATDSGSLAFCPFIDAKGNIFVEYRVQVIPLADEEIISLSSEDEIVANFGTIAIENELAYGCSLALKGAQGRGIYAIRVRSIDAAGFTEAVRKTESNASTYNFAPITSDHEVMDAVIAFNEEMSQPDVKKWRVTRLGVDFPGEYDVTSFTADNKPLTASFTINQTYGDYEGTLLSTTGDIDFTAVGVSGAESSMHVGDKVRINSTGAVYVIKRVISSKTMLLEGGPSTNITTPIEITLIKADTAENELEYVTNMAKSFSNRRVTVVWADQAKTNNAEGHLVIVPNKFLACEIAGLASAILPQKAMTRTEITSVHSASRMYTKYTQKQLDNIAKEGVMIITQDTKGDPCYVRHQLTTEVDKGSLYYEDSCTRNLDNISYHIADIVDGFIGGSNVVLPVLRKLKAKIVTKLVDFMQDTTDAMVGPSLVEYSDLNIYQDPIFKDRVIVKVKLYLPLPLNNIKAYEMAYAATVTL